MAAFLKQVCATEIYELCVNYGGGGGGARAIVVVVYDSVGEMFVIRSFSPATSR